MTAVCVTVLSYLFLAIRILCFLYMYVCVCCCCTLALSLFTLVHFSRSLQLLLPAFMKGEVTAVVFYMSVSLVVVFSCHDLVYRD